MTRQALALTALLAFGSGSLPGQAPPAPAAPALTFAVKNVRIFDGERVIPKGTVVVRDGRIAAVGANVEVPAGVTAIDGAGGLLLPGLIDSHVHMFGLGLERALAFGVTTVLDMFTTPEFARGMREEQARPGGAPGRADLLSAGYLATVPGGHGTEYGVAVPTLTKPEEAQAWVDARIAEGSDYIKIVLEDGSAYGRTIPSLDRPTFAALVKAAHARGKLAVVHVSTAAAAKEAIEEGADGLVHLFTDRAPDPDFVRLAKEHKIFVIPTLTVLEGTNGIPSGKSLTEDARVRGYLQPEEIENLKKSFPAKTAGGMPVAFDTVRQLLAAGVPILAGTDAPNPGTWYGVSVHRELELLVQAGLTPEQALAAATSAPARAFHLPDRGRLAPGLRADMILVAGDPLKDVTDTRKLVRIWKGGQPFERQLATAAPPAPPKPAAVQIPAGGIVSSFDDGTLDTVFGTPWIESTDKLRGGTSEVHAAVVDGGAGGTPKALEIKGEVKAGFGFPWAGASLFLGGKSMTPLDFSSVQALEMWVKGDDRPYSVLLFATNLGMMPSIQAFTAGPEWKKVTIPLSGFPGADVSGVLGFFVGATMEPGAFELRIDGVRLVKKE